MGNFWCRCVKLLNFCPFTTFTISSADGIENLVRVEVQDPDRRRANVLRLLQPEGGHLLQTTSSFVPGTQPRSALP